MVKIMENLIKMDDLGVPLFLETPNMIPNNWPYKWLTGIILVGPMQLT